MPLPTAEPPASTAAAEEPPTPWMAAMFAGDFEAAWLETDRVELARRAEERRGTLVWQPHHLYWNGEPFEGKRVLVRCNHGLGDTLQFIRYLPRIRALAEHVIVLVQPHLLPLLSALPELGEVRNAWTDEPPPPHDIEVEIMELAYAFRSTAETLPREVPYLRPEIIRAHANPLTWSTADQHALKVGLLWSASDWDITRSVPLEAFDSLAQVPGVEFYSLQQGPAAVCWRDSSLRLHPLHEQTVAIAEAAAAMLELDLIITVDSMSAHLAGALGRPVWVLLKHRADWRWMSSGEDSPWYPTMHLFRQPEAGNWGAPIASIRRALVEWVDSR